MGDGKRLARGEGNKVVVCCAESGFEQCQLNVGGPVTAVKFAGPNTLASSADGSTKFWDLGTGQETAEAVPEGFTLPKEGGAKEQKINSYVVAAKGQTLVIHKAPEDKAETAADGSDGKAGTETPVAFFQCAAEIKGFDVAGAKVAVGCARAGAAAVRGGAAEV